jgi:hypothetical protein
MAKNIKKKKLKFKELTKKQIEKFGKIYMSDELGWGEKIGKLHKMTGLEERTIRRWAKDLGFTKRDDAPVPEEYEEAKNRTLKKRTKKFLVTWAQNNTEVHEGMIENMEAYAEYHNAEIITILGRYRNPTTVEENSLKPAETWSQRIKPYWSSTRHDIHEYLSIMADVRVNPTAVNPMSGMYSMSGENSCIFGHPKVQLEMIPIMDGYKPKMMMTTGACTKLNYSDSKAGKKGEFHHTYGFVMVEIQDKEIFHTRQVTVNEDGSFYDLFYHVADGDVTENYELQGIILGDLHYGEHDQDVIERTMELMGILEPETVVLHDVFDAKSISHHTMKDPFVQYGMEVRGENDLGKEVDNMMEGLSLFEDYDNVVVVRANHDVHLDKFLQNDWRKLPTPKNNVRYMQYAQILLEQHAEGNVIGVIPALINERYPKYTTLKYNDSYKIGDWEVGSHGDIGANGSRGSIQQFRKLNTKMVTAHTHQPSRKDGSVCVGTTTKLRLSYNLGPSSWLNSHAIIHPDNRLQQVHFIGKNKDYTTFTKKPN